MNTKNNIKDYALRGIANGINICKEAVAGTIGGAGKNVIIRQEYYPYYISTKDAFSIIQAIKCEDPLEKQAVDMMRDATDSMNKIAKDGRTAMCLLTDAILQETLTQQLDPSVVEKQINEYLPIIEQEIDKQTVEITVDEVEAVARTASNSDRIAKIIGDIYKKQGAECIINHVEASGTTEDYVLYHDGVRFKDTGFLSDSFVHDEEAKADGRTEKQAVYKNPVILVTKRKIETLEDIDPFITKMKQSGKNNLIIFTDDMDSKVATALVNTHKAGIVNICIIKAPIIWKQFVFEDFAKCTGATIVEDATGVTFKNLALNHLGTCGKIVIDKEECVLTGIQDISEHIADLKVKGDDDSLRRVAWLTSKTATIRLGATNEGELSNLRLAAQDAVYSCQAALQSGVVEGGGKALAKIDLGDFNKILSTPMNQIKKNGSDVSRNLFEIGIVDSALVVKNSIRNAIKIASVVLKTEKLIDIPKPTLQDVQMELLLKQQRPW